MRMLCFASMTVSTDAPACAGPVRLAACDIDASGPLCTGSRGGGQGTPAPGLWAGSGPRACMPAHGAETIAQAPACRGASRTYTPVSDVGDPEREWPVPGGPASLGSAHGG